MAKTYNTIPTVATGDVYTATAHNNIATNVNNYRVPPMCRVYRNAALNHTNNGNFQDVSFDTESFTQTDSGMWTVGDPTLIYTKTAGLYLFTASLEFAANATGFRGASLVHSTAGRIAYSFVLNVGAGGGTALALSSVASCSATDTIKLQGFQSSGGNLGYSTGQVFHLSATWLGQVS